MRFVDMGISRINPEQVVEIRRVFYSFAFDRDVKKCNEIKRFLTTVSGIEDKKKLSKILEDEYPQGEPVEENYWVTRVTMSNGNEHFVSKSVDEVEALLVG